jgi:hypothetical protein
MVGFRPSSFVFRKHNPLRVATPEKSHLRLIEFGEVAFMIEGIILIIVGLLQLLFGRRITWLFIGLSGFLLGYTFAARLLPGQPLAIQILIGLLLGLVFGGLAIVLQKPLVAVAAFIALGSVGSLIASAANLGATAEWVLFVILGLIGAVVIYRVYEWGLIAISSLNGAAAILSGLSFLTVYPAFVALLLGLALAAVGIIFQGRDYQGELATA